MSIEKMTDKNKVRYLPAVCSVLAFLAYLGTIPFHFVYDDISQLLDNPSIRSWHYLSQYFSNHMWAGVLVNSNYYRPLVLVWFRLNDALFGLNPAGWHFSSAAAHAVATLLVFRLVYRLFPNRAEAGLAALIFGLHPLHVQSAAWISGITDPLLAIFMIGSFLQYLGFRDSRNPIHLAWSLVLYALATLTKEPAVVLPAIIVAHEILGLRTSETRAPLGQRLRTAGVIVLPFAAVTVLYLAARSHALHGLAPAAFYMDRASVLATLPSILWLYSKHLLLPWGYSLYYDLSVVPHFRDSHFWLPTLCVTLLIAILAGIFYKLRVPRSVILMAVVWFTLPLLPSLYLPAVAPEVYGQDRYLYVSLIGFSTLAAVVIVRLTELIGKGERKDSVLLYAGTIIVVTLASCTLIQQQYWDNNIALYQRAVSIAPNNEQALANLAVALAEHKPGDSLALFERCLRHDPNSPKLNYLFGYTLYRIGQYSPALAPLSRAAKLDPGMADAYLYIGMSHLKLGSTQDAKREILHAIFLEPERRGTHLALGAVLEAEGNLPGALAETQTEAKNFPDDPLIRERLAVLQQKSNQTPDRSKL